MVLYSTCLTYRSKQASTTAGGLGTGLACHQPVKKAQRLEGLFAIFERYILRATFCGMFTR